MQPPGVQLAVPHSITSHYVLPASFQSSFKPQARKHAPRSNFAASRIRQRTAAVLMSTPNFDGGFRGLPPIRFTPKKHEASAKVERRALTLLLVWVVMRVCAMDRHRPLLAAPVALLLHISMGLFFPFAAGLQALKEAAKHDRLK
jgi:hypothetical protein